MSTARSSFRWSICFAVAAVLLGGATGIARAAGNNAGGSATPAKPALVDLNTATLAQLEEVPGIGAAYAKRIVAARPYASVKELSKSGIPAARLKEIEPLVTVQETKPVKTPTGKPAAAGALVDINSASEAELEKVNGVGAAYAKRIVAARPYANVQELSKSGIPASSLAKIIPQVTVSAAPVAATTTAVSTPAGKTPVPTRSKSATMASKPTDKGTTEARTPPKKGMVWVNTETKVYHMEGDQWYGTTKKGEWMTEEDALKAGFRKAK